jgi:CxxC motif-containing protein
MSKIVGTVCSLCPVTCEMSVTFDDSGNIESLSGDQCESGKTFVEQNKDTLLASGEKTS